MHSKYQNKIHNSTQDIVYCIHSSDKDLSI